MALLLNSSTPLALWYEIIHEAELTCATTLQEELEAYLAFLMIRFTNRPEIVKEIMATEFLAGLKLGMKHKQVVLQQVGDKCLIFSGLFPHIVDQKLVKISYFVNLGQSAYSTISHEANDIYWLLARHFVPLMDVLQSIRQYTKHHPDLLPMDAYELWCDTGSKRALSILQQYTNSDSIIMRPQEKVPNR